MNPLPNEWAIKHRADSCAVTQRPFVPGEYFYTLLYHGADGYRREDLSEEAWQSRNENIRPFSFWKSRYEPLAAKTGRTSAQGKCRATFSPFDGIGFIPRKCLLRPGSHARTETSFETIEDRRSPQPDAFSFMNTAPQATCSSSPTRNCGWTNWKMCRMRWQNYFAELRKMDNI